uniref:Uncharacterized protein n=1 Tax=Anguilla anguilla TaxID=7936 RepID=A0A0E9VDD6_ANGAN
MKLEFSLLAFFDVTLKHVKKWFSLRR